MKSNKRITIILVILIYFSLFINTVNLYSNSTKVETFTNSKTESEKKIKTTSYWNLTGSPIYIDNSDPSYNWSKTAIDNDWCRGNGTWNNPYIIENVTIDGQGSGSCIEIRNSNEYFIIRNCTLYRSGSDLDEDGGIKLLYVNNGKVIDNNCSYNNANGIFLQWSNNNSISGNIINNNGQFGLRMIGGPGLSMNNIITFNNISHNNNGIYLEFNIAGNNISHNIINNNYNNGIILSASNRNNILDNKIHNNNNSGISIINCHNNVISNNEIYNNEYSGIEIDNSWSITTSMNEINSNEYEIHLEGRFDNVIFGNNVSYNIKTGIFILDSVNNNITNNDVNNNEFGISLENTNTTYILKNDIINNTFVGLYLYQSNYNDIIGNALNGNTIAMQEIECQGNYFKDNSGIPNSNGSFPFEIVIIIIIVLGIITAIIAVGMIAFKRKVLSKRIHELVESHRTEAEVQVEKEKHFCVVHRGKITGAVYICPECETYYCMKCATVLKKKSEKCWACNSKIEI